MKLPVGYLGIALVYVHFWETDGVKKRRLLTLANLLKEGVVRDAILVESLMACVDLALTNEWKKFHRMMRGRFVVSVEEGPLKDPSSEVADLFHWLRSCYALAEQNALQPECLRVEGRFLMCV